MKVLIEKELTNPVMVDGIAEVLGPHYHIYRVDEDGNKTFVKTVDKDIKEAAREAERMLDFNVLEVAYKEKGPGSFKSSISLPPNLLRKWKEMIKNSDDAPEEGCVECQVLSPDVECSKHYF